MHLTLLFQVKNFHPFTKLPSSLIFLVDFKFSDSLYLEVDQNFVREDKLRNFSSSLWYSTDSDGISSENDGSIKLFWLLDIKFFQLQIFKSPNFFKNWWISQEKLKKNFLRKKFKWVFCHFWETFFINFGNLGGKIFSKKLFYFIWESAGWWNNSGKVENLPNFAQPCPTFKKPAQYPLEWFASLIWPRNASKRIF